MNSDVFSGASGIMIGLSLTSPISMRILCWNFAQCLIYFTTILIFAHSILLKSIYEAYLCAHEQFLIAKTAPFCEETEYNVFAY